MIIDGPWNVSAYYYGDFIGHRECYICPIHFLCPWTVSTTFCSCKRKESRVCEFGIHFDLHKLSMLLPTVNQNSCHPWTFQLMAYKCGPLPLVGAKISETFIFPCLHRNLGSVTQPCMTSHMTRPRDFGHHIFAHGLGIRPQFFKIV